VVRADPGNWHAGGPNQAVGEAHARFREPINVGRMAGIRAITPDALAVLIIGHEDENVGTLFRSRIRDGGEQSAARRERKELPSVHAGDSGIPSFWMIA